MSAWLQFVKAHKSMRMPSGALDLKGISKLYHERGYDLRIKGSHPKLAALARHLQKEHPSTKGRMRLLDIDKKYYDNFYKMQRLVMKTQGEASSMHETPIFRALKMSTDLDEAIDRIAKMKGISHKEAQDIITDLIEYSIKYYNSTEDKEEQDALSDISDAIVYDPAPLASKPPERWFAAMKAGIDERSDVRNPYAIVKNIWARLTPKKRAEIRARESKGEQFKYDLPLPDDRSTRGVGTLRMVKPFKLAEVQVNLSLKDYMDALKSGLFSKMKRQDGTTALVARCKSENKNCNIFVDKVT